MRSINLASDAFQIQSFVTQRGIKYLCHFTTVENLKGIFTQKAILSVRQLLNRQLPYTQIDSGRWDGNLNHICCSISNYNYAYFYHAQENSPDWALLGIKPDYLWREGTLFSPINAASKRGVYLQPGLAGLEKMFAPQVIDVKDRIYTRERLPLNQPTCVQAEVQVFESIALEDILFIALNPCTQKNLDLLSQMGWQKDVYQWNT